MSDARKIRIGLAGLGFMAATHVKASRQIPEAEIVAVCNPSGRNLDGDLTKVGGNIGAGDPVKLDMSRVKAGRDYAALLADPEIDLIDICTPTLSHPEMLEAALRAGKHVLCEKPLARNSQLARRMADAARLAQTYAMPAMCMRFWPGWVWLKEAIQSGRYGNVLSARFRRVAEPPGWGQKHFAKGESSGGALLDLHIHDVDFVQFCFGTPRRVFAAGYSKYTGAIDHVVAQFEVESGAIVQAEGGWAMSPGFGFSMSYTVNFEQATADFDLARAPDQLLKLCRPGAAPETVACGGPDGYVGELRYFIDCILRGTPPQVVTLDDAATAIRICEAEEASIRTRSIVAI